MTGEVTFVFVLIGVAGALMASNRVRFDIVALLVVLALMLSGVLTAGEALAGFGSSVVILVAALLVIGETLDRTGVARAVGDSSSLFRLPKLALALLVGIHNKAATAAASRSRRMIRIGLAGCRSPNPCRFLSACVRQGQHQHTALLAAHDCVRARRSRASVVQNCGGGATRLPHSQAVQGASKRFPNSKSSGTIQYNVDNAL